MTIDFHTTLTPTHGSLYDRGQADSYYSRPPRPHYYPNGTYNGDAITSLTPTQEAEYLAGYYENEANGDKKDWT